MATPVTSMEIGSPNRSLIALETGAIGGQVAEWTAFLRFDLWLSGPLVAIGILVAIGPFLPNRPFILHLLSFSCTKPPVSSKDATAH